MKNYEVWYFIYSTEFFETVVASNPEEARYIVKCLLTEFGINSDAFFIDAVVEVV